MAVIQGTFSVNGIPRNGATAKLWPAGSFSSAPAKNSSIPSGSPTASGTTGPTHGHDGAYRFSGVTVGEYYVSFEWNGGTAFDYHARNVDPRTNVKTFGAAGDGSTDDTSAIQSAITAAGVSGASVYFPPGTYIVSPSGMATYLQCSGSLTIEGDGPTMATIKVKNNNPAYERLFGAAPASGSTVNDITFRNLIIDQNCSNVTGAVAVSNGSRQIAISFYAGENITVENCLFKNIGGVNTIIANGTAVSRVRIVNNSFKWAPSGGVASYDNTAVYINAEEGVVAGNMFNATPSGNARAAVQITNGNISLTNNTSIGYRTLADVVSVASPGRPAADMSVVGNVVSECNYGISLWSVSGSTLSNVTVASNSIQVSQVDHNQLSHAGIRFVDSTGVSGSFANIAVVNNTISFQQEAAAGRTITNAQCFGIGVSPQGDIENVIVTDNLISGAPVRGIRFGNTSVPITIRGGLIGYNQFINCGYNILATNTFRAAVSLESNLHDVKVMRNLVIDTSGSFGGYQSFFADSTANSTYTRCELKDNYIAVRSTSGGYRFNVPTDMGIDFGEGFVGRAPTPLTDHARYRFEASWAPSGGSFDAGDYVFVRRTTTHPGTMYLYRVTSGGTFGTLTSVSGTTTAGSNTVTVNDTTNIKVGDYITIAGVSGIKRVFWVGNSTSIEVTSAPDATVSNAVVAYFTPVYELAEGRESFQSAAPTTGTWLVGDKVWNSAPAASQPPGWVCVTSGTPGTWKAMANLAA